MATYMTAKDTAKLVRAELAAKFPGYKFSVRAKSFAGGSSVDVTWTDGPTGRMVDAVIGKFSGKGPTDNTDYTPSQVKNVNGHAIQFAGYLSCQRSESDALTLAVAEAASVRFGVKVQVNTHKWGTYIERSGPIVNFRGASHADYNAGDAAIEMLNTAYCAPDGTIISYVKEVKAGEGFAVIREY